MNKSPEEIMREAEALIDQVQRNLGSTADFFRDHGLDSEKLFAGMSDALQAEAQALFRKDMEEVERAIAEEAFQRGSAAASPRAGAPHKLRNMI